MKTGRSGWCELRVVVLQRRLEAAALLLRHRTPVKQHRLHTPTITLAHAGRATYNPPPFVHTLVSSLLARSKGVFPARVRALTSLPART